MLFAYAWLFPDMEFLMFFVIPVKVKWLAWLALAASPVGFVQLVAGGPPAAGFVQVAGSGAGFLYFWLRHHGRFKAKKAAQSAVVAVKTAGAVRADVALEKRNRDLFPRVEELRRARQGGDPPPRTLEFEEELRKLVVPGVNVCKPRRLQGRPGRHLRHVRGLRGMLPALRERPARADRREGRGGILEYGHDAAPSVPPLPRRVAGRRRAAPSGRRRRPGASRRSTRTARPPRRRPPSPSSTRTRRARARRRSRSRRASRS